MKYKMEDDTERTEVPGDWGKAHSPIFPPCRRCGAPDGKCSDACKLEYRRALRNLCRKPDTYTVLVILDELGKPLRDFLYPDPPEVWSGTSLPEALSQLAEVGAGRGAYITRDIDGAQYDPGSEKWLKNGKLIE